jgi:plastocyanin
MRIRNAAVVVQLLAVVACSAGYDGPSGPGTGGGGGGGGGPVGSVSVGPGIQFVSRHNGTTNPAVDTIEAGGTVTWTWSGSLPHSVQSVGTPGFAGSGIHTGRGTYAVTFATPGTYSYQCGVHGQAMSGRIVVIGDEPDVQSATVADAAGDTFGSEGVRWDATAMTVSRDTDAVTVVLEFARAVISPMSGDTTAVIGVVDLDLDQNAETGNQSVADEFRLDGGSTEMGSEALINLTAFAADSSVEVRNVLRLPAGRVRPVFEGRRITVRVPRLLLGGDDGFVNATAIVGDRHRPTDIVPETGHLTLRGPTAAAAVRVAPARAVARRPTTRGVPWR